MLNDGLGAPQQHVVVCQRQWFVLKPPSDHLTFVVLTGYHPMGMVWWECHHSWTGHLLFTTWGCYDSGLPYALSAINIWDRNCQCWLFSAGFTWGVDFWRNLSYSNGWLTRPRRYPKQLMEILSGKKQSTKTKSWLLVWFHYFTTAVHVVVAGETLLLLCILVSRDFGFG